MKTLSIAATFAALLTIGAGTSSAQAIHNPFVTPSAHGGTMLGIYAVETLHGLKIMGTVDGYSAHGRLLPGDILLRATTENLPCFSLTTHHRMEYAKSMIGANRIAAIEFFRPGVGNMYAWMTFELQTNVPHTAIMGITPGVGTFKAEFILESEKPGAQELFAAPAAAETTVTETPAADVAEAPAATAPANPAPAAAPNAAAPADAQAPVTPAQPAQPQQPTDNNSTEAAIDALLK